jgi:hypothetical protein
MLKFLQPAVRQSGLRQVVGLALHSPSPLMRPVTYGKYEHKRNSVLCYGWTGRCSSVNDVTPTSGSRSTATITMDHKS